MTDGILDRLYSIRLTDEQRRALELAERGESFKINAFAGTGKTTTIKAIAKKNPNKSCLYLAFNSAIANELRSVAPHNLQVYTIHQYARRELYKAGYSYKLAEPEINYKKKTDLLLSTSRDLAGLPAEVLMIGLSMLDAFCRSTETEIRFDRESHYARNILGWSETDSPGLIEQDKEVCKKLEDSFLLLANKLWSIISSKESSIPLSFDFYLKIWQLSSTPAEASIIFIDEAQDLDPVMFSGIAKMDRQLILVGDTYQQIYQWRGAVNAMEKVNFPSVFLTQTFRFPPSIARIANICLKKMGEENQLHSKIPEPSSFKPKQMTIINRTNLSVIRRSIVIAKQGVRFKIQLSFSGGIHSLKQLCIDIFNLKKGKKSSNKNIVHYKNYLQIIRDQECGLVNPEISSAINLLEFYSFDIFRLASDLDLIINNSEREDSDCELLICTAHASKGKEWDYVEIGVDFEKKLKSKGDDFFDELRLFYVAITRAKVGIINHQYVEGLASEICI